MNRIFEVEKDFNRRGVRFLAKDIVIVNENDLTLLFMNDNIGDTMNTINMEFYSKALQEKDANGENIHSLLTKNCKEIISSLD